MTRFTGAAQAETAKTVVHPVLLVDILSLSITTNDAPVVFNGKTYAPTAFTIDGPVAEVTSLDSRSLSFTFPASDSMLSIAGLSQPETWTDVTATIAFVDQSGAVLVGIAMAAYVGKVVSVDPAYDTNAHTVSVACQDVMSLLGQRGGLRFNTQDQHSRPGASTDTFFDTVPKLRGRAVMWAQKRTTPQYGGGGGIGGGGGNRERQSLMR